MTDRLYTQRQIRDALVAAGAPHYEPPHEPGLADVLAAIAMAETPVFDPGGYSNFDRQGDLDRVGEPVGNGKHYGPSVTSFQIRTFQEDMGTGSRRDMSWLLIGLPNACKAAIQIAQGSGLTAWTTFTSGRFKAYMQDFYPPPAGQYLVVSGDTFYRIDAKLGLPRGTMQRWNPTVDPRKLYSGRVLELGYVERTVQPGNTLYYLMKTAGWTNISDSDIQKVASYAGLVNPNLIHPGQVLRILRPGYEP